ncbi:MAG: lysophospholipid acyltransferase family protein [Proteobacteria bacterium]|nr:lysophospholipid acyltransferase family protein [Pseudomonadota bacterium]
MSDIVIHEPARVERPPPFIRLTHEAAFHDEGYGYDLFGLHPPTLARMVELAAPVYERYFRVASHGSEQIPSRGPVVLVGNHGGVLPVDAGLLCLDLLRRLDPPRFPRPIADHFVPRLPLVSTLFARCGMVSGTRGNVARLLERNELVAIWPEGVAGPAKHYRDRYQLQAWRVGFAELAIRYRATVIPVAIVGAEESWPLALKLWVHWLGTPYLPVPAWPLPLPTRIHIQYGAPIRFDQPPEDADDPAIVDAAAGQVRAVLERQLADLRAARRGWFR